jgi:L-lactate dehydrogenase complex protein LldG
VTALLAERIADYSATVARCPADSVPGTVAAALIRRQARRVVMPAGLDPTWLSQLPGSVEVVSDDPPLAAEALDAMDGVVTTCAVAIAETGTVVLDGGAGQGRRALTLVPDYHLVVVPADRVVATVPAAIAALDPGRPLTWISGPSATSYIALDRGEGVHGPRNLEVILPTGHPSVP